MGRQRTPNEDSPASAFLKNWISEIPPPRPLRLPGLPSPNADPGPTRRPRPPESPPLGPFRPRHPTPLAGTTGAAPGRSRARRRGAESRVFRFSDFGGAKAKSRDHTHSHIRATHEPIPGVVISFPSSRDGSASVRDRFGFGSVSGGLIH